MSAAALAAFARRRDPGAALSSQSPGLAQACHDMTHRFHRGGKLIVFGNGGAATDAQHLSVEFMHPVIVKLIQRMWTVVSVSSAALPS